MNREDVKVMFVPSDIIDGYKIDRLNKFKYINVTDAKVIRDLNTKISRASEDALLGINPELIIDDRTIRELCLTDKSIDLSQDNFQLPESLQNYGDKAINAQYPVFYYRMFMLDGFLIVSVYDKEFVELPITDSDDERERVYLEVALNALRANTLALDVGIGPESSIFKDLIVYYSKLISKNRPNRT